MQLLKSSISACALAAACAGAHADVVLLSSTVRDFQSTSNPDFNHSSNGGVVLGIVKPTLDPSGNIVDSFASNVPGQVQSALTLNKWFGACDGSQFSCSAAYTLPISANLNTTTGVLSYANSNYFPLDAVTDPATWQGKSDNYLFTTKMNMDFTYHVGAHDSFSVTSTDDVWVFVNGRLVIDMGGIHGAAIGTFDLDSNQLGLALGLTDGQAYDLDIFKAQRGPIESSFGFTAHLGPVTQDVPGVPNGVPEPGVMTLLGIALFGLFLSRNSADAFRFSRPS